MGFFVDISKAAVEKVSALYKKPKAQPVPTRGDFINMLREYANAQAQFDAIQSALNQEVSELANVYIERAADVVRQQAELKLSIEQYALANRKHLLENGESKTANFGFATLHFIKNPDRVMFNKGFDEYQAIEELKAKGFSDLVRVFEELQKQAIKDNWTMLEAAGIESIKIAQGKERVDIKTTPVNLKGVKS